MVCPHKEYNYTVVETITQLKDNNYKSARFCCHLSSILLSKAIDTVLKPVVKRMN